MNFRPPANFKPIHGFQHARFCEKPGFVTERRVGKGARADGIRYENKVQDYLVKRLPSYMPSPWISFVIGNKIRFCQPDGLNFMLRRGVIQIIEVKLRHTDRSYWQTEHLYRPLLKAMFPDWTIHTTEVVKWYDNTTAFPCEHFLQRDLEDSRQDKYGVHILWPIPKI